jgi:hypothetical protein
MPANEIVVLLDLIDQAFDRSAWHGTNLRGSIRGLNLEQVCWRPAKGKNNIWELVIHAAYWKYAVRRRLLNEKKGSFPLAGSNFIARPSAGSSDKKAWDSDVKMLVEIHRSLRQAIAGLDPKKLKLTPAGSKVGNIRIINGIAAHDLYHAGQIQLIKRLYQVKNK